MTDREDQHLDAREEVARVGPEGPAPSSPCCSGQTRGTQLDAFLDGELDSTQRWRFEERIEHEGALRVEVERQQMLDASLRRAFAPPDAGRALERLGLGTGAETPDSPQADSARDTGSPRPSKGVGGSSRLAACGAAAPATPDARAPGRKSPAPNRLLRRLAIAAVLVGGLFGVWQTYEALRPQDFGYAVGPPRDMTTVYGEALAAGFEPVWVCDTDEEFALSLWLRFRQAAVLRDESEHVRAVGWSYAHTISRHTMCLYAQVSEPDSVSPDSPDAVHVIVFVDLAERDDGRAAIAGAVAGRSLSLFRREAGPLVLYELTPLDRPAVFDLFEPIDMPREWIPGPGVGG